MNKTTTLAWSEVFSGRSREIEMLLDAWSKVTQPEPVPQVVVLLAESGLGKTRLVQEFYGRIASSVGIENTNDYWPAQLGRQGSNLTLNPKPATCGSAPLPYLWWALRGQDPLRRGASPGDAVSSGLSVLRPHLQSVERAAHQNQLDDQQRSLMRKAGTDAAVTAVDLLSFGVLGVVRSAAGHVGEFLDIRRKRQSADGQLDMAEVAEQERDSLVDRVVRDLGRVMTGPFPGLEPIPTVVIVDDAQFASADPTLLDLIDRLTHRALLERWPLLLILTHWEQEWHLGGQQGPQNLVRILEQRLGSNWRPYVIGKVDDLTSMLDAGLPGLKPGQRQILLQKADGNPRLLDEIMRRLLSRPRYFEGRDITSSLSHSGEAQLEKADFDLHELIEERLSRAPDDIREAVAISSVQGLRFLEQVTLMSLEAQVDTGIPNKDVIQRSERPYAFVSRPSDGIAEFAQRVYFEVASEILCDIADESAVKTTVVEVLHALAGDDVPFDQLPEAVRSVAREVGINLLLDIGSSPADRTLAARCLVASAEAALDAWDYAAAAVHAQRATNALNSAVLHGSEFGLAGLSTLLNAAFESGATEAALQLTDHLSELITNTSPSDPLCRALELAVLTQSNFSGWLVAQPHLKRLVAAATALDKAAPSSESKYWVFRSNSIQGEYQVWLSGAETAVPYERAALKAAYEALDLEDSLRNRRALLKALRSFGAGAFLVGKKVEGQRALEQARTRAGKILNENYSPESYWDWAISLFEVGRLGRDKKIVDEAIEAIRQQSAREGTRKSRRYLMNAIWVAANQSDREHNEKQKLYSEGLRLARELDADRSSASTQRAVASFLGGQASLLLICDPQTAVKLLEQAVDIARTTAVDHASVSTLQNAGYLMELLAQALRACCKVEAAMPLDAEVLQLTRTIAERWPSVSTRRVRVKATLRLSQLYATEKPSATDSIDCDYSNTYYPDAGQEDSAPGLPVDLPTGLVTLLGDQPAGMNLAAYLYDVPFYPGWRLLRLAMWYAQDGGRVHSYVLTWEDHIVPLDSLSDPIRLVSMMTPIRLNDENVLSYVRFYCRFIQGENGPFPLITKPTDVPLAHKTANDTTNFRHEFYPPQVTRLDSDLEPTWIVKGWLYHDSSIAKAEIEVRSNGDSRLFSEEWFQPLQQQVVPFVERAKYQWNLYGGWPTADDCEQHDNSQLDFREYCESFFTVGRLDSQREDADVLNSVDQWANAGSVEAKLLLGQLYRQGLGVKQDEERALVYLHEAADLNNVQAMAMLGLLYDCGSPSIINREKADLWRARAEESGGEFRGWSRGDKSFWVFTYLHSRLDIPWETPMASLLPLTHAQLDATQQTNEQERIQVEADNVAARVALSGSKVPWMTWDVLERAWICDENVVAQLAPIRRLFPRGLIGLASFIRKYGSVGKSLETLRLVNTFIVSYLYKVKHASSSSIEGLFAQEDHEMVRRAYQEMVEVGMIKDTDE